MVMIYRKPSTNEREWMNQWMNEKMKLSQLRELLHKHVNERG